MKNYRTFHTPFEVEAWVSQHYTQAELDELNMRNDLDSPLAYYKGSAYKYMNQIIRKGYPVNETICHEIFWYVVFVQKAL